MSSQRGRAGCRAAVLRGLLAAVRGATACKTPLPGLAAQTGALLTANDDGKMLLALSHCACGQGRAHASTGASLRRDQGGGWLQRRAEGVAGPAWMVSGVRIQVGPTGGDPTGLARPDWQSATVFCCGCLLPPRLLRRPPAALRPCTNTLPGSRKDAPISRARHCQQPHLDSSSISKQKKGVSNSGGG